MFQIKSRRDRDITICKLHSSVAYLMSRATEMDETFCGVCLSTGVVSSKVSSALMRRRGCAGLGSTGLPVLRDSERAQ